MYEEFCQKIIVKLLNVVKRDSQTRMTEALKLTYKSHIKKRLKNWLKNEIPRLKLQIKKIESSNEPNIA